MLEEAEKCRRQAVAYIGEPEGTFLLRVASEFERLAKDRPRANQLQSRIETGDRQF
jgi:hypothetical protein